MDRYLRRTHRTVSLQRHRDPDAATVFSADPAVAHRRRPHGWNERAADSVHDLLAVVQAGAVNRRDLYVHGLVERSLVAAARRQRPAADDAAAASYGLCAGRGSGIGGSVACFSDGVGGASRHRVLLPAAKL